MKRVLICVLSVLLAVVSVDAREPLTFEERVKAQEAIERVYYNHRIWPKENPQPKPAFEKMVTKEQIEAKVTDYLKKCAALDQFWQRPIIASQLKAEMERMAKGSKDPATLNELFAALDDDAYIIAECLARPMLADRLIHNWYANDERFHGETKAKAEEALKNLTTENFCGYPDGQYSKFNYRLEIEGREELDDLDPEDRSIKLEEIEFAKMLNEIPDEGKISAVQEKNECFLIVHTISKNEIEIEIESMAFAKQGIDEWLKAQVLPAQIPNIENGSTSLYLPPMPEGICTEGWDNGNVGSVPEPRLDHTAVWTGSEMIVWGGSPVYDSAIVWEYNPATDIWTPTANRTNCPTTRGYYTAIWTGTEMIIWGGSYGTTYYNTGGKYDPETDIWSAISTGSNCPSPRKSHSAVWTGTGMIIWGGYDGSTYLNSGGRYTPGTDSWTATSTGANCPSGRVGHAAVWTGTEMIVWGGQYPYTNTGGRYTPGTDTWTATSMGADCPSARRYHTAVWTGTEMVVWGGYNGSYLNTGGRYAPGTDTWMATSVSNCPSARYNHSVVWTGTIMIVWGGQSSSTTYYNTGGKYNPNTDTWTATSTGSNCPSQRNSHSAVWTGTEMIVWGGYYYASSTGYYYNTGGRYNPSSNSWVPTFIPANLPSPRYGHSAVWTGTEMIIWGGRKAAQYYNTGARYNLSTDSWTPTSTGTNVPSIRENHSAIWTGSEMIIWGGAGSSPSYKNDGGRYNPVTNSWTPTTTTGAPGARDEHAALWTGTEMIIWGGYGGGYCLNTGGKYDPSTDTWVTTSTGTNCPSGRINHCAVWTGTEMVVWGGSYGADYYLNTGGRYSSQSDSWRATSYGTNCPSSRTWAESVWTGDQMLVWGGYDGNNLNTGGRYDPLTDSWQTMATGVNVPQERRQFTAVWTGSEMVVWGGVYNLNTGGRYAPLTDLWQPTLNTGNVPDGRCEHKAVWTGSAMIVWGGYRGTSTTPVAGGIYYIPYAPFGWQDNFASDNEGCASDSGVLIEWSAPVWGDGSSGTRTFDVLRDGAPVAIGLSESTLSHTDTTGDNGVSYLYQVRANNGCGLSTTTAGVSAADNIGASPDEVANFDNVFSWDPVSGADGYRLYRGTLAGLPNLMTSTADGCLRYEGTATSLDTSADDPSLDAGKLYWYLVTAYAGVCEGTAGNGTGFTRNLSSLGICP